MPTHEDEYREAVELLSKTQRALGAISKGDPERETLKLKSAAILARMGELKEAIKAETTKRNFAGLTSPLHAVCAERLAAGVVSALEARALEIQEERNRIAAERRAEKEAVKKPSPPPQTPLRKQTAAEVEIVRLRPNGGHT